MFENLVNFKHDFDLLPKNRTIGIHKVLPIAATNSMHKAFKAKKKKIKIKINIHVVMQVLHSLIWMVSLSSNIPLYQPLV